MVTLKDATLAQNNVSWTSSDVANLNHTGSKLTIALPKGYKELRAKVKSRHRFVPVVGPATAWVDDPEQSATLTTKVKVIEVSNRESQGQLGTNDYDTTVTFLGATREDGTEDTPAPSALNTVTGGVTDFIQRWGWVIVAVSVVIGLSFLWYMATRKAPEAAPPAKTP